MRRLSKAVRVIWAAPNSLIGLGVGIAGLMTGGGVRWRQGCLEFWGGAVARLLQRFPLEGGALAMTLGHTILGQTPAMLDFTREHEHVHVRQYERWGPFFLPAYFACSLFLWLRKRDSYHDNPFEREAYAEDARRAARRRELREGRESAEDEDC